VCVCVCVCVSASICLLVCVSCCVCSCAYVRVIARSPLKKVVLRCLPHEVIPQAHQEWPHVVPSGPSCSCLLIFHRMKCTNIQCSMDSHRERANSYISKYSIAMHADMYISPSELLCWSSSSSLEPPRKPNPPNRTCT